MKIKSVTASLVVMLTLAASAGDQVPIPAFPGAEGFGALSNGGRGGDVYIVTNLNAKGDGSFHQGITTVPPQGRTIVFAVSGYIPINKPKLKASNVTIAGQTAPGDGVGLRGSCFWISGSDVVVRFMRFRHGNRGNGGDALETDSGARNLLIDHCDVMFAKDENFSMFKSAPPTMTFQWSIDAWGLYGHACGGLWMVDHTTAHHTLWANNKTRNPKVICPKLLDWTNNVSFGWDIGMNLAGADKGGLFKANLRGSSFIRGGGRSPVFGGGKGPDGTLPFHVFLADCALDGNGTAAPDVTAEGYALIDGQDYHKSPVPFPQTMAADPAVLGDPVLGVPVKMDDRRTAYKKVISQVGVLRMEIDPAKPLRDEVSTLLVEEVVKQKRRKLTSEEELGVTNKGFGTLASTPAPADSDRDGMPDFWETALGWDPQSDDHNTPLTATGDKLASGTFFPPGTPAGYTRLEEYLHFLAIPHGTVHKNNEGSEPASLKIDLRKFTGGFTAAPVFTLTGITGGKAVQDSAGDSLVTFTPTPGHTGRAGFDFTVTDNEGSSWKQSCALLVVTPAPMVAP